MHSLALIELDSIARGYRVLDAMVKKAPIEVLEANLVEPGKFLILFGGDLASVEESFAEALDVAQTHLVDKLLLPMVHDDVVPALAGSVKLFDPDAIGIIETRTVAAGLWSCDRVLKDAWVRLAGLRITPGLGGKAYFVFHGAHTDVEAALEVAKELLSDHELVQCELVARPHQEFLALVLRPAPFSLQR